MRVGVANHAHGKHGFKNPSTLIQQVPSWVTLLDESYDFGDYTHLFPTSIRNTMEGS